MKTQIFSNSATMHLFDKITDETLISMKGNLIMQKFSDDEICMQFPNSIRGNDIFIMGDTSHNLEELIFSIDAAHRASVKSICVILPYYGYGRQDRKGTDRVSIGAKVMAKILEDFKIDRLVTIDLHAVQIEGFFNIPLDHIKGHTIFLDTLKKSISNPEKIIICAPDEGGNKRARSFADLLGLPMVAISKKRGKPNEIESMNLMGDVSGMEVWIIDDMADTCGTLCKAASYLKEKGAIKVSAIATHGLLSGQARHNLEKSDLSELIISDTCATTNLGTYYNINDISKVKVISCIDVLQKAILGIINEESLQLLTH